MSELVRGEAERMRRQGQALTEMPAAAPDEVLSGELDAHSARCQSVARQLDELASTLEVHSRAVEAPAVRRHLPELAAIAGAGALVVAGVFVFRRVRSRRSR
ncbi:hypothetical protein AB0I28_24455 [Phytomonospora sp. NPDC050363]|uniref:hypothetical protein n=1 Tax=Phytomonospora sp. NPDC050363 TaxID=3155642 RepID=UPI003400A44D